MCTSPQNAFLQILTSAVHQRHVITVEYVTTVLVRTAVIVLGPGITGRSVLMVCTCMLSTVLYIVYVKFVPPWGELSCT